MMDDDGNAATKDDPFPRLTVANEDTDKHLLHRLQHRYGKDHKDFLNSTRRCLESKSTVKYEINTEALEALKQKILNDNIRREQEQRDRRLKAFGNVRNKTMSVTKGFAAEVDVEEKSGISHPENNQESRRSLSKHVSIMSQGVLPTGSESMNKTSLPQKQGSEVKRVVSQPQKQETRRTVTRHSSLILKRDLAESDSKKKARRPQTRELQKSLSKRSSILSVKSLNEPKVTKTRSQTMPSQSRDIEYGVTTMVSLQSQSEYEKLVCACAVEEPMEIENKNSKIDCGMKAVIGVQNMDDISESLDHIESHSSKSFTANVFPPLNKTFHYSSASSNSFLEENTPDQIFAQAESTTTAGSPVLTEPSLQNETLGSKWNEESHHLNKKIKEFVAKPIPTLPPSSLKIRRSTIHNIDIQGLTKGSGTSELVHTVDRKKSLGVVNMHTCPTLNLYKDRSWMYQDRKGQKCRYIRVPSTPIPPIDQVFSCQEEDSK